MPLRGFGAAAYSEVPYIFHEIISSVLDLPHDLMIRRRVALAMMMIDARFAWRVLRTISI